MAAYGHLCDAAHPSITEGEAEIYLTRDLQTALVATLRYCPVLVTEPFGTTAANNTPTAGQAALTQNLRFPGQVHDPETGMHYNYFHDYIPGAARYAQSDPIGLDGGINTFAYVENSPASSIDPDGLYLRQTWDTIFHGRARNMVLPSPVLPRPYCTNFSVSAEAYAGFGGGLSITWDRGTLEIIGRVGTGIGGGAGFDPNQRMSPHSQPSGSGYIARTAIGVQGDFSIGPVGVGGSYTARSGNAVTTPVGGGYTENSFPTFNGDKPRASGWGFRGGAYMGPEIGSYTNWGNNCGCPK